MRLSASWRLSLPRSLGSRTCRQIYVSRRVPKQRLALPSENTPAISVVQLNHRYHIWIQEAQHETITTDRITSRSRTSHALAVTGDYAQGTERK
jgi:hypothetical protein